MTNLLLIIGIAIMVAYGFWVMKRVEDFLNPAHAGRKRSCCRRR